MAQYTVKYRSFDQLLEDVTVDFSSYALEGMIEPQQLIKVALRVNYDLGLRIHQQKEVVIDIEHGKAKLPADFYTLNFALLASKVTYTEIMPSGTHIEDVIVPLSTNCVPTAPTTNTTTTTTTEEVTTGGTPAVTQEIVIPGTPGTLIEYEAGVPTNNLEYLNSIGNTFYNPLTDDFVLTQSYNAPFGLQTYNSETGAMLQQYPSIDTQAQWIAFTYFPEHAAFLAYSTSNDGKLALFDAITYQKISQVTNQGLGMWSFVYDSDNECIWGVSELGSLSKITIVGTGVSRIINITSTVYSTGLSAPSQKGLHLDFGNQKIYIISHNTGGDVSNGWMNSVSEFNIINGNAVFVANHLSDNTAWAPAAAVVGLYKPRFSVNNTVLDTVNNRIWVRASDSVPPSGTFYTKLFYIDLNDYTWNHHSNLVNEGLLKGVMILNSFDGNILYNDGNVLKAIDPSDLSLSSLFTLPSSGLGAFVFISVDLDGDLFIGTAQVSAQGKLGYFYKASYTGGTGPTTQTIIVTPAVPGTTTSTTTTTSVNNTSGIDALYQCQPENTCINKCGQYYQLVQKFKTHTATYETLETLRIKPSSSVSGDCPNTRWSSSYQADIRGGFIYTSFQTGKLYLNYQGALEDENGELQVMDHPMINEYYEYAVKQRILENMYINGEDVVQKLSLVEQRLRAARNNALSIVNTPDFAEMKKLWEVNRKAQYHKYVDMFKSYPTVQY